ncbi:MAG: 4-hydroxy-tetrahydrodipicolinate synthase [Myxococcales bacterium]|nr:4-hydroxy-tetrahydrodipicolinate synthase [Myxococcales bacterium]
MAQLKLEGTFTALVTPFSADGAEVDFEAYERQVEHQVRSGVRGLVPCATTSETPTLTEEEQVELIRRTAKVAAGKVPVLAGTGSSSTKKTLKDSLAALEAGADAVMIVMPYYNKPSQAGMVHHVETLARELPCPIVLYNVPGRTGVELSVPSMLAILDRCPNVVGMKDATGNVLWCQSVLSKAGDRLSVLCGDDALSVPCISVGAKGLISVSSNAIPELVVSAVEHALAGRSEEARAEHHRLLDFHALMFEEPNPAPVKLAMELLGLGSSMTRSPMLPAGSAVRDQLVGVLSDLGLSVK